jgi:hypothetical protein
MQKRKSLHDAKAEVAMAILEMSFDDARTKMLGDAFDTILIRLHGTAYPESVKEAIADRVIEIAGGSSERDPQQLADAVVASLGIRL